MLAKLTLIAALFSAFPAMAAQESAAAPLAPAADHHQHLFSKPVVAMLDSSAVAELPASGLIALLDSAGIRRAVVFSVAYMYGSPKRKFDDEYAGVYGTDSAAGDNLRPRASWAAFRQLPLTAQELDRIAANVAPYLRD